MQFIMGKDNAILYTDVASVPIPIPDMRVSASLSGLEISVSFDKLELICRRFPEDKKTRVLVVAYANGHDTSYLLFSSPMEGEAFDKYRDYTKLIEGKKAVINIPLSGKASITEKK